MDNNTNHLKLASPWRRIVAYLIDTFITDISTYISMMIVYLLYLHLYLHPSGELSYYNNFIESFHFWYFLIGSSLLINPLFISSPWALALYITSVFIIAIFFIIIPLYLWKGQTIGKKLLKIRIVQENGQLVKNGHILKKYAFFIIGVILNISPILGLVFSFIIKIAIFLNTVMLFADEKRQTLFDKFAKTIVVNE